MPLSFLKPLGGVLLLSLAACGGGGLPTGTASPAPSPSPTPFTGTPNIVLIVADDMGYADLSSFGAPRIRTPNIDRLATEGARLTDFRVTSALCTPSRGSILTGLYPPRTGLVGNLPSGSPTEGQTDGIDDNEITLPEMLRERGYATHAIGKWHLGSTVPHLPTRHGFDSYFGISNGDQMFLLLRDTAPVRDPPGIEQLAKLYTEEAVRIVRGASPSRPFFLYLSHRSPHQPLEPAPEFRGRSAGGLYGDVVEELDWSVGEVVRALRETGQDRRTLVVFLSDNGPPLEPRDQTGSAAPFRGHKNSPYEGGFRVPAIAWWPGRIPAGQTIAEPLISIDLFPTMVALAGGQLSPSRRYYGTDVLPLLAGTVSRIPGPGTDGNREMLGYYFASSVSLRSGRWKYIGAGYWDLVPTLYDLQADPGEATDVYPARPDVVRAMSDRFRALTDEVATGAKQPKKGGAD